MPFYRVDLPTSAQSGPLLAGTTSRIVHAATSADAIAAAKASQTWDADAAWAAATVTELTAQADMLGVTIKAIAPTNVDAYKRPYSYTGIAGDKLHDLLVGLAAVMNLDLTNFPNTITVSGNVLTIPSTNNIGDLVLTCALYLNGVAFAAITCAVSATGAEASSRTITLSGGSMQGSRMRVTVADPTNPVDCSVFLHDGETIDLAAARLVVLLNATTLLSNVSYTNNIITIAGASDAQGAKVITAAWTRDGVALPELAMTVNAPGVSSIDRTITLAADGTLPVPQAPLILAAASIAS